MSGKPKLMDLRVEHVYVEESKEFEDYVAKRLLSIMCGNVPFDEACNMILNSITEDKIKEDSATSTKQTTIFKQIEKEEHLRVPTFFYHQNDTTTKTKNQIKKEIF